jgi:hypothetical protein
MLKRPLDAEALAEDAPRKPNIPEIIAKAKNIKANFKIMLYPFFNFYSLDLYHMIILAKAVLQKQRFDYKTPQYRSM